MNFASLFRMANSPKLTNRQRFASAQIFSIRLQSLAYMTAFSKLFPGGRGKERGIHPGRCSQNWGAHAPSRVVFRALAGHIPSVVHGQADPDLRTIALPALKESRRDSASKPKVATQELPWV
jgi:hypothetical protein